MTKIENKIGEGFGAIRKKESDMAIQLQGNNKTRMCDAAGLFTFYMSSSYYIYNITYDYHYVDWFTSGGTLRVPVSQQQQQQITYILALIQEQLALMMIQLAF